MTSPIDADSAYLEQILSAKPQRIAGPSAMDEKMLKNTIKYLSGHGIEAGYCDRCRAMCDAADELVREHLARPENEKKRDKERRFDREIKHEEQGGQVSTQASPPDTVKVGRNHNDR